MSQSALELKDLYQNKSVLVTGGLGFLGSSLASMLNRFGCRVTVVDALLPQCGGSLFNIRGLEDKVKVNICDLRDAAAMDHLVKGRDIIFHFAGLSGHLDSLDDPLLDQDINVRGTLVLLEACRRHNPAARVVYAGTRAVYGRCGELPCDESRPVQPLDFSSLSRAGAEGCHMLYHRHFGLPAVVLRLTNTYGPRHRMRDERTGALNWFVRCAMDGSAMTIYGHGSQMRDYTYVDDVTEAFLLAGVRDEAVGEVFNLGSGEPVSLLDAAKAVIQAVGAGSYELAPWPGERGRLEIGDYTADYGKISATLGWEPRVSLLLGLQKTVDYYGRYRAHYW